MLWILGAIAVAIAAAMWTVRSGERDRESAMSPQERLAYRERQARDRDEARLEYAHGLRNPAMICPHCQTKGTVRTKAVELKKGISGGKATAAILTGGVSMLATGLSRVEGGTRAHCDHCSSEWTF